MTDTIVLKAYKRFCAKIIQITEKDMARLKKKQKHAATTEEYTKISNAIQELEHFRTGILYQNMKSFVNY